MMYICIMIRNKLHTISDEDAIEVARILLLSVQPLEYTFNKIIRQAHDPRDGVDSEETVNVYFNATVTQGIYRSVGWKDREVMVKLIEHDRYHGHPYFTGLYRYEEDNVWKHEFLANQIEAVEFLQSKGLL